MRRLRPLELALRCYPRSWRSRYGQEVRDLASELTDQKGSSERRVALGVLSGCATGLAALRGDAPVPQCADRDRRLPLATGSFIGVVLCEASPAESSATTVPFTITSGAMAPALTLDQSVQVKPFTSNVRIAPGEIVIFRPPRSENCGGDTSKYLVKRIVALPGQTISLAHGNVVIDGKALPEPWLPPSERRATDPGPAVRPTTSTKPYRLPADRYFVLGDNRIDSCDSRYWGPVPRDLLYGAVVGHSSRP